MLLMPEDVMQQPANRSIAPQNQIELQQSGFVAPPGTEIDHWIAGISVKLQQSQNVTKSCAASRLAASLRIWERYQSSVIISVSVGQSIGHHSIVRL